MTDRERELALERAQISITAAGRELALLSGKPASGMTLAELHAAVSERIEGDFQLTITAWRGRDDVTWGIWDSDRGENFSAKSAAEVLAAYDARDQGARGIDSASAAIGESVAPPPEEIPHDTSEAPAYVPPALPADRDDDCPF